MLALLKAMIIFMEPYLDVAWKYIVAAVFYIVEVSRPAITWAIDNVPQFIDWVSTSNTAL